MSENDRIIKALDKFENKLDSLDGRLDSMDKTLVKQEANLGEHMRRTELAEESISELRKDVEPIKRHVAFMEGALKGVGVIATVVSVIAGIIKVLSYLQHIS